MRSNTATTPLLGPPPTHGDCCCCCCVVSVGSLKRRLSIFLRPDPEDCYPSPPMSDPPSPPRHPRESSLSTTEPQPSSSTITSSSVHMPGLALSPPSARQGMTYPYVDASAAYPPPFTSFAPALARPSAFAVTDQGAALAPAVLAGDTSPAARSGALKAGRKSKTHVASACVNCKRAHLSCDVSRPCNRCVATGKEDTCYDVQHKKRGRPRLREEGEFKVEQMIPGPGTSVAGMVNPGSAMARPIATTRTRRSDSFRSIRSHKSEGSLGGMSISPSYPITTGLSIPHGAFVFQQPVGPGETPAHDIPTALLDLDLVIIKANLSFRQALLGGQEVAGRPISELVEPAGGENLEHIRMRLRDERERREPTHMPPILQPGQNPIESLSEGDVERYAQGYDDKVHTWTSTQTALRGQSFPARVRLARAEIYFVVVTLPMSRFTAEQVPGRLQLQPTFVRTPTLPAQMLSQDTPIVLQANVNKAMPSSGLPIQPTGHIHLPMPQPRAVGQPPAAGPSRMPAPSQPSLHAQHLQQPARQSPPQPYAVHPPVLPSLFNPPQLAGQSQTLTTAPRFPVSHPPTPAPARRATLPSILDRPPSAAGGVDVQLPPLIGRPPARPSPIFTGTSQAVTSTAAPEPVSASSGRSEYGDNETDSNDAAQPPRKRQRLGIDDVLQ